MFPLFHIRAAVPIDSSKLSSYCQEIAITRSIVYRWTVYHMLSKLSNESMFSFLHFNITQNSACTSAFSKNDENSSIYVC